MALPEFVALNCHEPLLESDCAGLAPGRLIIAHEDPPVKARLDDALANCERALEARRDAVRARVNCGHDHLGFGRAELALSCFARALARLQALRSRLALQRSHSPLFDTERFTHHLEAAYLRMHEQAAAGELLQSSEVCASPQAPSSPGTRP